MYQSKNRTLEELLSAYSSGQRHFIDWDFDEDLSVKGLDLSDVSFESCFLFLDFRETKLINSKFIQCNIKTADFRDADLTNAIFKNCSVESIMFKGAKTKDLIFEENYAYGNTFGQDDFESFIKDNDTD